MKGSMQNMSNRVNTPAVEETLKLYHAWLGYLLTRLKTDVLRVRTEDIRRALDGFSCAVSREGEEYVIRLQTGKEVRHDGSQGADT